MDIKQLPIEPEEILQITVQIETDQTGDKRSELFYVPADLRVENGQVIKQIDPKGKSVLIFNSKLEVDDAVRSAGYLPRYTRTKI